jgi:hypothetical protein
MSSTAERVDRIDEEIRGVAAQYGVTSWEREFLAGIRERGCLSERQEETLAEIEKKVFGG